MILAHSLLRGNVAEHVSLLLIGSSHAHWTRSVPLRRTIFDFVSNLLEASYHRVFNSCDAKWLSQAGVKTGYVKLEDVGLPGNAHEMNLRRTVMRSLSSSRAGSRRTCTE
jgi:hypothetical protein